MIRSFNPNQTVLFPELFSDHDLPSITTLPEYDNALRNFIKISDFGAFLEINFIGIDKSYSISPHEIQIPRRYLAVKTDTGSPVLHLFSTNIRNHLNRLKYDVRSFFNKTNSIKTSFGYFLFRQYFHLWDRHKQQFMSNLSDYLNLEIGATVYQNYYIHIWSEGSHWLKDHLKRKYRHLLPPNDLNLIEKKRSQLQKTSVTLSQLDRDDPEYFFHCLVLKTAHIPIRLSDYIDGIAIHSTFKTIHLEHLKDIDIETIEDITRLLESFSKQ